MEQSEKEKQVIDLEEKRQMEYLRNLPKHLKSQK